MIPRHAATALRRLARGFPVLAITGPRQSGKTTLARSEFAHLPYVSLENPQERDFALLDPARFLQRFANGAVLDEVQRCPQLLSWLQQRVDEDRRMGAWVLTGSAQFDLMAGLSQSLAGRVGRVELLPLSGAELGEAHLPAELDTLLLTGGYPALYDRPLSPADWFANYVATYVERDVRQLLAVQDLQRFGRFVHLCAARSGQLLNLASLGADSGITSVTANAWLTVLEASYLALRITPYHRNFGKRLVKAPKLVFLDVGLMAWLLGIRDAVHLSTHPARGALFETWVTGELVKARWHAGERSPLHFWRSNTGLEVDLLWETAQGLQALEVKSGATFASDWPQALQRWQALLGEAAPLPRIVYGGTQNYQRQGCAVSGWHAFALDPFNPTPATP